MKLFFSLFKPFFTIPFSVALLFFFFINCPQIEAKTDQGKKDSATKDEKTKAPSPEQWLHRGGPYHWFNLKPISSTIKLSHGTTLKCKWPDCQGGEGIFRPVFLADCKLADTAVAGDEAAKPLLVFWNLSALPGDPEPLYYLWPLHWFLFWKPIYFFDTQTILHLNPKKKGEKRLAIRIRRKRWSYNTNTRYEAKIDPYWFAREFSSPGKIHTSIKTPAFQIEASYHLSSKTLDFIALCAPTLSLPLFP